MTDPIDLFTFFQEVSRRLHDIGGCALWMYSVVPDAVAVSVSDGAREAKMCVELEILKSRSAHECAGFVADTLRAGMKAPVDGQVRQVEFAG